LQPGDADANLGLAKTLMPMREPEKASGYSECAESSIRTTPRFTSGCRPSAMKEKLTQIYRDMRLKPAKEDEAVK
jgi:hypothetical protein